MSKVKAQFTMSLDGFIAGPDDDVGRLFQWFGQGDTEFPLTGMERPVRISRASADLLSTEWEKIGAIVTGRRDFDVSRAWGGNPLLGVPHFIVTHSVPPEWAGEGSPFTFITEGVERAVEMAQQAAGDKDVTVGGTQIVRQCLRAGLLDQIQLDLVPLLLGKGIRLFDNEGAAPFSNGPVELEIVRVIEGQGVTHLIYNVLKS